MRGAWLLFGLVAACGKGDTGAPVTGAATGTATGAATGTAAGTTGGMGSGTTTAQLPADPRPVTVDFTGDLTASMDFDTPTCTHYPYGNPINFRTFWRGTNHNVVLIAEVLGDFAGAGDYATGTHNLRVKLQTEAGSTFSFQMFQVDTAQGDAATLSIDHVGDVAWGEFSFTGMHGLDGALTASPSTIPVWCETVEN